MSSEVDASPAILKQIAPRELDKVLSIKSYAEVTKRNGDGNEQDPLKNMPFVRDSQDPP